VKAAATVNHELAALIEDADVSHAQLARQVVLLGKTEYGLRLAYDYRSVGRWLRGAVPDPPAPKLLASVLSRLLGRTLTLHDLGFQRGDAIRASLLLASRPADTVGTVTELWRAVVERRAFMHTSAAFVAALAVEATLDWRDTPASASVRQETGTRAVTDSDVEMIRQARDDFRRLDHVHGGGYALSWLEHYLHTEVAPLLQGRYTDRLGRDLFLAAATLTDMAGWMSMDAGFQSLGQRFYTQAAALAKHAGDNAYGAYVLGNLATQALFLGQTRTAIRLARSARAVGGRAATPALTARITLTEARALALTGDSYRTRRALRTADRAMNRAGMGAPEWLGVFTPGHYAGLVMHTLRDLGQAAEAQRYAADALNLPAVNARTHALHSVLHATVLADRGELDGAVEVARPVQSSAGTLKSKRLSQRLDEFAHRLTPHQDLTLIAGYLQADALRHRTAGR
jgi:hypothetical protein